MGVACTKQDDTASTAKSREIERIIRTDNTDQTRRIKILLLGTGDSGKSTFFKQIRGIHTNKKDLSAESKKFVKVLRQNAKLSMQRLIVSCQERNIQLPKMAEQLDAAISAEEPENLSAETAKMIQALWANDIVREAYEKRHELKIHIPTNADYYFKHCNRFATADYVPTFDDMMMAKLKTTGVQEAQFKSEGNDIILVDVGGQRSERRKWLHCLDDVIAIIYMCAMDDYDSMLEEDGTTNRLQESLELFSTVTSSTYFADKGWILFLNKKDLFEAKIKTKPLTKYFSNMDPKSGSDYTKCSQYLFEMYKQAFKGKHLQHHFTCALDTDHCAQVFNLVREFILTDLFAKINSAAL